MVKFKHLFAAITVFAIYTVAAAQNYYIRITYNTNLRAWHSLEARIVETAPAGSTLQVTGEVDRWLQISRNGTALWMANWVSHTRVDANTQTGSASQIDNCCFVDRQCNNDQQWEEGYWAYQNGQCAAPAQSQTGTSGQPTATVNGQIDNCCFVDRQCNSDQQWLDGYWAFQNGHCSAPAQGQSAISVQPTGTETGAIDNCCFAGWNCNSEQQWINGFHAYQNNQCDAPQGTQFGHVDSCCQLGWNCSFDFDWIMGRWVYADTGGHCGMPIQEVVDGVIVEGSSEFIARIKRAMHLVKSRSPEWYAYSITGARKIREYPWTSGDGTLEQSYNLTTGFVAGNSIAYLAAVFVHENCHIQRWLNGNNTGGYEHQAEEAVCDTVAINALNVISPGAPYPRGRINDFLALGLPYDVNAGAQREWERALFIHSQRS